MKRWLLFSVAVIGMAAAVPAWACGGCVSPVSATVQQTVVQDAERVVFVRDEATGTSHVWVEVRYSGLAKDFGWVLPLPKVPKVGVGSRMLFDQLDQAMRPSFNAQYKYNENCRNPFEGCDPVEYGPDSAADTSAGFQDSSSWADSTGGPNQPGVEILAQGSTGPYDYSVIQGSDSAALYAWLTTRGYALPEKAKPILQSHIAKGDVFVAVKLSNGQGVQDIRPIALEMQDAEPCVPLRLTSIAAKEDLSVVVTVAGKGRAIVKNHLDIVPNPFRMTLMSFGCSSSAGDCSVPGNYQQVVSAAIDSVGGHAFVTESSLAGAGALPKATLLESAASQLIQVSDMAQLATMLSFSGLPLNEEVAEAVALPLALTATFPGVSPLQTLANLKACGLFWQMGSDLPCQLLGAKANFQQLKQVGVDGKGAKAALDTALLQPLAKITALITGTARVTRLVMRISPEEMDRDPVFAFHPTLPVVPRERYFQRNEVCLNGWSNGAKATRLGWDGLGSWLFTGLNTLDPRFVNAPLVLQATLQDEQGEPVILDPSQYELVDTAIMGAIPGKPSLPKDLVLKAGAKWLPPPSDPLVTALGPWKMPAYGCVAKPGWVDGKMAPKPGQVIDAGIDITADASDGQGQDGGALADSQDATDGSPGAVPGIDAAGGWVETTGDAGLQDAAPAASPPAAATSSGGCQAGPQGPAGPWALLLLAGAVLRRRRLVPQTPSSFRVPERTWFGVRKKTQQ